MKDRYGRIINYMRISITDRCNLRCGYCLPDNPATGCSAEGKSEEALTGGEILSIAQAAAEAGITRIRLTGGEPLMRKDVTSLIGDIKKIPAIQRIALTTNGVLLKNRLAELVEAGLDSVSISLDTLDQEKYRRLTGSDRLADVLASIDEAKKYEGLEVKINSVIIRDFNEDELCALASLARGSKISVRFIELMPIGPGKDFAGITADEMIRNIESGLGKKLTESHGGGGTAAGNMGPAHYYDIEGFVGQVGFIDPVSHKFCDSCNRIRVTSDGRLRPCLQYEDGEDLKAILRRGADKEALTAAIKKAVAGKPEGHNFNSDCRSCSKKFMSQIGG